MGDAKQQDVVQPPPIIPDLAKFTSHFPKIAIAKKRQLNMEQPSKAAHVQLPLLQNIAMSSRPPPSHRMTKHAEPRIHMEQKYQLKSINMIKKRGG